MKKILPLLLLAATFGKAQNNTDTIFRLDSSTIVCKIKQIKADAIVFDFGKLKDRFIDINRVSFYSINGARTKATHYSESSNAHFAPVVMGDSVNVSDELNYMRACLRSCHKEYVTGLVFIGASVAIGMAAAPFVKNMDIETVRTISFFNGIVFITGVVLMIDSHKWINRAGLGLKGEGNRIGIYYRFK